MLFCDTGAPQGDQCESWIISNANLMLFREQYRVMREVGKENNSSASLTGSRSDHDRHSVVSNTMQKVSIV